MGKKITNRVFNQSGDKMAGQHISWCCNHPFSLFNFLFLIAIVSSFTWN